MNNRVILGLMASLLLLAGCAKKVNIYTSEKAMEEFTPEYLDFDFLSAKARIVMEEENGKTTRGTLNLRAKKDSVIWFSLSPGLGIEAARGMITQEAIKIKDRMNGHQIDLTFDQFQNQYGLRVSLDLFQNILFANIPNEVTFRDRLVRVGKTFKLTQERDDVVYESVVGVRHGKVTELQTSSSYHRGKLTASYPEFENINEQPFAHRILLKMLLDRSTGTKSTLVSIEVNKIDLLEVPLSFPYNF